MTLLFEPAVVVDEARRRSAAEFRAKFGWKNDPDQALLLGESSSK